MGEMFDYALIGPNQGLKTSFSFLSNSFPLMWTYSDTRYFKQPTNCFIFGIPGVVTAFCKLLPKTNCHIQNDIQVPAENHYKMGSYLFKLFTECEIGIMYSVNFLRFLQTESSTSIFCRFV